MTEILNNTPLLVCLLYLAICLIVGLSPGLRRVDVNPHGFVAARGEMSSVVLFFIIGSAIFSSLAFLGGPATSHERGAASYAVVSGGILGAIPFFFLSTIVRERGLKNSWITQGDFFSERYDSPSLSIILALFSVLVSIPYLILQIKGAGIVLNVISDGLVPAWFGGALTYAIVCLYVLLSGVRGVGWSNVLQGAIVASIAIFIGWYFPTENYGGVGEMFTTIDSQDIKNRIWGAGLGPDRQLPWSWTAYSSTLFVVAAGFSCWPHLFMKCFAADSQRSLRRMASLYPLYALLMFPLLFVGYSSLTGDSTPSSDSLLLETVMRSSLPDFAIGLIAVAVLAASMSSGDTILHSTGSIVVHDGARRIKKMSAQSELRVIRIVIVLVLIASYVAAILVEQSIFRLYTIANGMVAQILPVTLAACYWQRSNNISVISALLSGVGVSIFFLFNPALKPFDVHEGALGLAVNVSVLILLSFVTRGTWKKQ